MFKINTSIQNHLRELLQNASSQHGPASVLVPFPSSLLNKQDKQTKNL